MDWLYLWEHSDDFLSELAHYTGIDRNHPKFGLLWNLAWERGHAGGIEDVVQYFEEMAELIK